MIVKTSSYELITHSITNPWRTTTKNDNQLSVFIAKLEANKCRGIGEESLHQTKATPNKPYWLMAARNLMAVNVP